MQPGDRLIVVLKERDTARTTHVLERGVWDAKGDEVSPGVIPSVLDWPVEKLQTRLDLAKWLVDKENPLTARVIVNQLWQIMLGIGLVRTPDDFGLQGQLPTHPELLDWSEITMGRFHYEPSLGPAQYRRTIYAFWRRSSAPTFLFDSSQRRVCETGVRLTNTPLQALTLLNDETMLEASRALADLVSDVESKELAAQLLSVRVLGRPLLAQELKEVLAVYNKALETFMQLPDCGVDYLAVGQQSDVSVSDAPQVAGWMTVSSLLLNLDEAISYE